MNGAKVGSLIGCCGGLAFYLLNAGPLSGSWPLLVRLLGVVLFVLVVGLVLRARVIGHGGEPTRGQLRAYGWTVIGEVAAIFIGSRLLVAVSDRTTVSLPWVAVVLGVHFVIFAPIFQEPVFAWFGVPIAVFGVVGLGLALTDTRAATIGVVAGIIPGTIMFAAVAWSAWVGRPARPSVALG